MHQGLLKDHKDHDLIHATIKSDEIQIYRSLFKRIAEIDKKKAY